MVKSPQVLSSVDELATFIGSVVADRYSALRRPTDGAFIAQQIRGLFPDFSYKDVGLLKLGDAVEYAERKGLLVRNRDVKHLEVLPCDADRVLFSTRVITPLRPLHIRPDLWRAFVFISRDQARYFDRRTGMVVDRDSLGEKPDPTQHVVVPGIPLADQQEWMEEFLRERPQLNAKDAPIRDAHCFTKFPLWLSEQATGLDNEWKQFRVHRVAERIRSWAEKNGIDPSSFFAAPTGQNQQVRVLQTSNSRERAIRAAVAAAARSLPLEQLQEISIPIRYVLQALKGT